MHQSRSPGLTFVGCIFWGIIYLNPQTLIRYQLITYNIQIKHNFTSLLGNILQFTNKRTNIEFFTFTKSKKKWSYFLIKFMCKPISVID